MATLLSRRDHADLADVAIRDIAHLGQTVARRRLPIPSRNMKTVGGIIEILANVAFTNMEARDANKALDRPDTVGRPAAGSRSFGGSPAGSHV